MKHYRANVVVPNEGNNEISYVIKLKNKCRFELNECYFTMYKAAFDEYSESDYFCIDLVTEKNKKEAEKIMRHAIDFLVYITQIPYELEIMTEDSNMEIIPIDIESSTQKILKLKELDSQYKRIRGKKVLLENVLRLYSVALKYMVLLENAEESYFAMFKVIEKIVKDEFKIAHATIPNGYDDINNAIKKITKKSYGVKLTSEKLDSISRTILNELFNTVFSDTYSQIAWFCGEKGIKYDENILAKAVNVRNKLAHGECVDINHESEEYNLVIKLSHRCIHEKFFNNVKKDCYLEADIAFMHKNNVF